MSATAAGTFPVARLLEVIRSARGWGWTVVSGGYLDVTDEGDRFCCPMGAAAMHSASPPGLVVDEYGRLQAEEFEVVRGAAQYLGVRPTDVSWFGHGFDSADFDEEAQARNLKNRGPSDEGQRAAMAAGRLVRSILDARGELPRVVDPTTGDLS